MSSPAICVMLSAPCHWHLSPSVSVCRNGTGKGGRLSVDLTRDLAPAVSFPPCLPSSSLALSLFASPPSLPSSLPSPLLPSLPPFLPFFLPLFPPPSLPASVHGLSRTPQRSRAQEVAFVTNARSSSKEAGRCPATLGLTFCQGETMHGPSLNMQRVVPGRRLRGD